MVKERKTGTDESVRPSGVVIVTLNHIAILQALAAAPDWTIASLAALSSDALGYQTQLGRRWNPWRMKEACSEVPVALVRYRRKKSRVEVSLTERGADLLAGRLPVRVHGGAALVVKAEELGWVKSREQGGRSEYTHPDRGGTITATRADVELPPGELSEVLRLCGFKRPLKNRCDAAGAPELEGAPNVSVLRTRGSR